MTSPRPIIMAPGVYFQEVDLSQYIRELTGNILALVGTASKGLFDTPIRITSLTQFIVHFGIPSATHPATLVAREFFNAELGMEQLLQHQPLI